MPPLRGTVCTESTSTGNRESRELPAERWPAGQVPEGASRIERPQTDPFAVWRWGGCWVQVRKVSGMVTPSPVRSSTLAVASRSRRSGVGTRVRAEGPMEGVRIEGPPSARPRARVGERRPDISLTDSAALRLGKPREVHPGAVTSSDR